MAALNSPENQHLYRLLNLKSSVLAENTGDFLQEQKKSNIDREKIQQYIRGAIEKEGIFSQYPTTNSAIIDMESIHEIPQYLMEGIAYFLHNKGNIKEINNRINKNSAQNYPGLEAMSTIIRLRAEISICRELWPQGEEKMVQEIIKDIYRNIHDCIYWKIQPQEAKQLLKRIFKTLKPEEIAYIKENLPSPEDFEEWREYLRIRMGVTPDDAVNRAMAKRRIQIAMEQEAEREKRTAQKVIEETQSILSHYVSIQQFVRSLIA